MENYLKKRSSENMKPSTVVIKKTPSRFRHQVPKYKVTRSDACINCGTCAKTCTYGVHERVEGHNRVRPPITTSASASNVRKLIAAASTSARARP